MVCLFKLNLWVILTSKQGNSQLNCKNSPNPVEFFWSYFITYWELKYLIQFCLCPGNLGGCPFIRYINQFHVQWTREIKPQNLNYWNQQPIEGSDCFPAGVDESCPFYFKILITIYLRFGSCSLQKVFFPFWIKVHA